MHNWWEWYKMWRDRYIFQNYFEYFLPQCLINFFILIFFNNYFVNLLFLENYFFKKKIYVLKIYHLKKKIRHIFSYFLLWKGQKKFVGLCLFPKILWKNIKKNKIRIKSRKKGKWRKIKSKFNFNKKKLYTLLNLFCLF